MSRRKRRRAVTSIFLVSGLLVAVALTATSSANWRPRIGPWAASVDTAVGAEVGARPAPSSDVTTDEETATVAASAEEPAAAAEQAGLTGREPVGSGAQPPDSPAHPLLMNYIVLPGDTLLQLAGRYETTVEKLLEYNESLEAANLRAGELIKVPDKAAERGELRPRYLWPADGPITTPFGEAGSSWIGGYHMGLDIGGFMGDVVWSAGDGVIVDTGTNGMGRGYGTYVLIYHYNGWFTLYAHLSKVYREAGYTVSKGEPIGEVGMTGFADGPHLHFEVWHRGERQDPIQLLP